MLPTHASTKEVCNFLASQAHRAKNACDCRSVLEVSGNADIAEEDVGAVFDSHEFMEPLAVAGYMLMTAAQLLPAATSAIIPVNPFDSLSLPDP